MKENFVAETAVAERPKMALKTRYSDEELEEFKQIILKKRAQAIFDITDLVACWVNESGNGTEDTSPTFKALEEGALNHSKEINGQLALRLIHYVQKHLDPALIRIENKSYGICRETGQLISRERLIATPHATLSIDAKIAERQRN